MSSDLFSKVLVIFFMFVNALIMANLLIAVMFEDYTRLSNDARPLYLRWLLTIEPFFSGDPVSGFLTFKFGPIMILNMLLSPALLFKSKRLNLFLEVVYYIPALLFLALIYFIIDLGYFFILLLLIYKSKPSLSLKERHLQINPKRSKSCIFIRTCTLCPIKAASNLVGFFRDAFSSP